MLQEYKLPDLGEGIHEGEIIEVKVAKGDSIKEGEIILIVETDKAAVEIPSPYTGVVHEVRVKANDMVQVGDVLIVFEVEAKGEEAGAAATEAEVKKEAGKPAAVQPEKQPQAPPEKAIKEPVREKSKGPVPASPATRKLARELGVDLKEIQGTGPSGLVTAEDVRAFAEGTVVKKEIKEAPVEPTPPEGIEPEIFVRKLPSLPDFSKWGEVKSMPLKSVRRAVAKKMALSWSQIPHVSHQEQVDITELERIRKKNKAEVEKEGGTLTLTAFVLKACAAALEKMERFNASIDPGREEIILKKYYHIGVATDTERGLLVPVIRDVDHKNLLDLAIELPQITQKARDGKLSLDEMQGGTFTITNIGSIGGVAFQPIINYPEVAILGLGRAGWQPVVIADDKGEQQIEPRLILPLILAFDHRVVDGADGARFANDLRETLENPGRMLFFHE